MASLCFATQKAENSANIQDFETKYIELQRGIWYNFSISNRQFFAIKKREGCIRGMKAGKGSQGVAAVCMLVIGAAVAYGSGPVYQKIQSAGPCRALNNVVFPAPTAPTIAIRFMVALN